MSIKLDVPSKGWLIEKTVDWFGERSVALSRTRSDHKYSGAIDGAESVELVLLFAGEIPGKLHLGVTPLATQDFCFCSCHLLLHNIGLGLYDST